MSWLGKQSLLGQPGLTKRAGHLLAIGGVDADKLVEGVGFANGHRRIHRQKRRDMLLGLVDAAEERQGVGEIEMREPERLDICALERLIGLGIVAAEPGSLRLRPPPDWKSGR